MYTPTLYTQITHTCIALNICKKCMYSIHCILKQALCVLWMFAHMYTNTCTVTDYQKDISQIPTAQTGHTRFPLYILHCTPSSPQIWYYTLKITATQSIEGLSESGQMISTAFISTKVLSSNFVRYSISIQSSIVFKILCEAKYWRCPFFVQLDQCLVRSTIWNWGTLLICTTRRIGCKLLY